MPNPRPPRKHVVGSKIPEFPDYVIESYRKSGAHGDLYRAVAGEFEGELAMKFVPIDAGLSDQERDRYLEEARRANRLANPSVVRHFDVIDYTEPVSQIRCVVFVCEFVHGRSIKEIMADEASRTMIDIEFIRQYLSTVLSLLHELKIKKYEHGDLHAGNVLVGDTTFDITGQVTFRITDFGVRQFTQEIQPSSDYQYVAETLQRLLECIDYRTLSAKDRYLYNAIRDEFLRRHLIETDPTVDDVAQNPERMYRKLSHLDRRYSESTRSHSLDQSLSSPFDYPNCEQLGDSHSLLKVLYSERLLGLMEIESRSNLVLTGPRGCGKTTVFRALSLDFLTATHNDAPSIVEYVGVYYRCDDLYFTFPRYEASAEDRDLDVPMHFLTVTLLNGLLVQIDQWLRRHFSDSWLSEVGDLIFELRELLGWPLQGVPNASSLATLLDQFQEHRSIAARRYRQRRFDRPASEEFFGPGVLVGACRVIRDKIPALSQMPFYFFIDDYSSPKISLHLQKNLNRLLMHRSSQLFFKISTESPVSYTRSDIDGKIYVEGREFKFLNLGLQYIMDTSNRPLEFIQDLFSRRFRGVRDYPVRTLEELLGSYPRNENAFARNQRGESSGGGDVLRWYAGQETVSSMCSGDIHYVIQLVDRMVSDAGGPEALVGTESFPLIPPKSQHSSIRFAAGEFMESIRTIPVRGQRLADTVAAFGNVAYSYLRHRVSRNRDTSPPHQASRIEPYEPLLLSEEEEDVLNDLLRYSIFIEDPRGKSRRGKIVPRYYLRRYLIPHFLLTFSRRDSLELSPEDIEKLLLFPSQFENERRLREDRVVDSADSVLVEGRLPFE